MGRFMIAMNVFRSISFLLLSIFVFGCAQGPDSGSGNGFLKSLSSHVLAPGDLDPTFGTGGKVTTDILGHSDSISNLALLPDGKLLALGKVYDPANGVWKTALVRYNSNGTLDGTFGTGGTVFSFGNDPGGLDVQTDGKIVIGMTDGFFFYIGRYNPDGTPDLDFGFSGGLPTGTGFTVVGIDGSCGVDLAGLKIQADGRIVAGGVSGCFHPSGVMSFTLIRLNSNGTNDNTFGSFGIVNVTSMDYFSAGMGDLAIHPDGGILAVGWTVFGDVEPFITTTQRLLKFNSNGSLLANIPIDILGSALAVQSDGTFYIAGSVEGSSSQDSLFRLERYNPDATPDTSFGTGGLVSTDFGAYLDVALAVGIQSDGKILVAGLTGTDGTSSGENFALARYYPDGSLDTGYGVGGKQTTDFGGGSDRARSMVVQPDGRIVLAGNSRSGGATLDFDDFALARYLGDEIVTTTTTTIPPTSGSDLSISITDAPDPVQAGDVLTYTMTGTNNGPEAAIGSVNIRPSLTVPPVSISSTKGSCSIRIADFCPTCPLYFATCTFQNMAVGETVAVTYQVQASGETRSNTALISSLDINDPDLSNNSATENTMVLGLPDTTSTTSTTSTSTTTTSTTSTTGTGDATRPTVTRPPRPDRPTVVRPPRPSVR